MKAVLISVKPKWCEKIASGKKTIEVRKSAPKEVPFKAYIYETKGATETPWVDEDGHYIYKGKGQVIGEFICDKVTQYNCDKMFSEYFLAGYVGAYMPLTEMCLTQKDLNDYGKGKMLYGLHIAALKIYDKPKELSEFYAIAESGSDCCCGCVWHETPLEEMPCRTCTGERKYLYRPPQSWCYVEEIGE